MTTFREWLERERNKVLTRWKRNEISLVEAARETDCPWLCSVESPGNIGARMKLKATHDLIGAREVA